MNELREEKEIKGGKKEDKRERQKEGAAKLKRL